MNRLHLRLFGSAFGAALLFLSGVEWIEIPSRLTELGCFTLGVVLLVFSLEQAIANGLGAEKRDRVAQAKKDAP